MEIIVKLLTLPKLRLKKTLNQEKIQNNSLKSLSTIIILHNLGRKPKSTRNTQTLQKSQMVNCLIISTGETLVVLITPILIEIKVIVVHATPFLSPKLLK
jgi:hypothetical protein